MKAPAGKRELYAAQGRNQIGPSGWCARPRVLRRRTPAACRSALAGL